MKRHNIAIAALLATAVSVVCVPLAAQDRYTLKSPNGIAFAEFRGYENWQMIASSQTDDGGGCGTTTLPCIKSILGNAIAIQAFRAGIPLNGKAVPDGAAMAKIEWVQVKEPTSPYGVTVPGRLTGIAFMLKDSKRFTDTDGWGYAALLVDSATTKFTAHGANAAFAQACHACHTAGATKARDFVFTKYAAR